jgi:hypothetical protein
MKRRLRRRRWRLAHGNRFAIHLILRDFEPMTTVLWIYLQQALSSQALPEAP